MRKSTVIAKGAHEAVGHPAPRSRPWVRPLVLALLVGTLLVLARSLGLTERLEELRGFLAQLGPLGPAVYALLYTAAVVAAVPGSLLTIAAGAMFGSVVGVAVVSVGSTLGAAAAFALARWLARDAVMRWLGHRPAFAKLQRLTQEHGALVVAFTRLVPLFPFNLLNYGFGLTQVPFRTYVFWSWLCMLPGTVLYVVGTDAVTQALTSGQVPWPLLAVLLTVAALLTLFTRRAKRALAKSEPAQRKEAP